MDITNLEIDGSKAVAYDDRDSTGTLVTTEDGREWYWYQEYETNYGEWREYKSN